ncbi:hypothetical protein PTTG_25678 [Puccinia triticina 1-1 BBBD Race 1]|uniref:CCHC-type domain-containing protein n=1 Tax=Puccinia triticina (isolate 1-1 / race 1 (BBBD)) TaxID=630390 RepID=A0A180H077_PUCT1|nr:hypothetical protein PTTG_25678 [Puccinia triticina 1-1 BBBD Race 1]
MKRFPGTSFTPQSRPGKTLKKININDYNSLAEAIAVFDPCAKTFVKQGIDFTWDNVIGLIIQLNLHERTQSTLDHKIDLFMEMHKFENPASSDVLRFWDAAQVEKRLAEDAAPTETSVLNIGLASFSGSCVSGCASGTVSGHQDNSAITANALTKPPHCYICKQTGHMSPNCPISQKNNPSNHPNPQRTEENQPSPWPYIKPIQPDTRSIGPPLGTTQHSRVPQTKPSIAPQITKQVNTRQINPELFAKEEDEVEYVFESENLSAKPTSHHFNLCEMALEHEGQEVIWDTGTSGNVTGNRSANRS